MASKAYQSERWLRLQYLTLRKSPEEIAEICGCTKQNIYLYIKKFGFKR